MLPSILPSRWTRSNNIYSGLPPLLPPEVDDPPSSVSSVYRSFRGSIARKRTPFCLLVSALGILLGFLFVLSFSPSWIQLPAPSSLFAFLSPAQPYYSPKYGFRPGSIASVPHGALNTSRFFPSSTHDPITHLPYELKGRPAQREREFNWFPFRYPDEANRFAEERMRRCLPRGFWREKDEREGGEDALARGHARHTKKRRRVKEGFSLTEEDLVDGTSHEVQDHEGDSSPSSVPSDTDGSSPSSIMEEEDLDHLAPPHAHTQAHPPPQLTPEPLKSLTDQPLPDHGFAFSQIESDWMYEPLPNGCGENERKIVLLNSWWFLESLKGSHTGEAEWAGSMIDALYASNYTMLFSSLGWLNTELWLLKDQYKLYEPFVKLIIGEPEVYEKCWEEPGCVKDPRSEVDLGQVEWEGEKGGVFVPWKMVSFHYWDYVANRLGKDWTLSPFPTNDHRFVSFSIEPTCSTHPYRPFADRPLKQAYIFGKQVIYLTPGHNETVWGIKVLEDLAAEFEIPLIAAMRNDNEETWALVEASDINNIGSIDSEQFLETLSESDVFIGIGRPRISPSPFDALCMGVPFINPIVGWDKQDYMDRSKWTAQQWAMHYLEPPYVYNVHSGDILGLRTAVKAALQNPTESYIPDYMTFDFVCDAMSALVDDDWKGKYDALDFSENGKVELA